MKETKIEIPACCEVEKIETQDGHVLVTFKAIETQLPKTWEEFCENHERSTNEYYFDVNSSIERIYDVAPRHPVMDRNVLHNRETAPAVVEIMSL